MLPKLRLRHAQRGRRTCSDKWNYSIHLVPIFSLCVARHLLDRPAGRLLAGRRPRSQLKTWHLAAVRLALCLAQTEGVELHQVLSGHVHRTPNIKRLAPPSNDAANPASRHRLCFHHSVFLVGLLKRPKRPQAKICRPGWRLFQGWQISRGANFILSCPADRFPLRCGSLQECPV